MSSQRSAFIGFSFSLPFIIINFIVALRIEPFYSFLGTFPALRNSIFFPFLLLLLFPIGAFIALAPIFKNSRAQRKFYFLNIAIATIMIIVFLILSFALGEETYRCNFLKTPNCD